MSDFNLHAPEGANKKKRIVGRGDGSGSGGKTYPGFEGGQMPLYRRLPSRGFSNYPFRKEYQIVNLRDIEGKFQAGDMVDTVALFQKGLVRKPELPVKVLGEGQISVALTLSVDAVSSGAKAKIEAAGGKVEVPAAIGSSADN